MNEWCFKSGKKQGNGTKKNFIFEVKYSAVFLSQKGGLTTSVLSGWPEFGSRARYLSIFGVRFCLILRRR